MCFLMDYDLSVFIFYSGPAGIIKRMCSFKGIRERQEMFLFLWTGLSLTAVQEKVCIHSQVFIYCFM